MTENVRRLELEDLAAPDALGRLEGKVVFVPYGAPGDVILVELVERGKAFDRGRIVELLEPGPQRIEPRCPHYGDCGGCSWQHLDYAAQLHYKGRQLADGARKIAGLELEPPAIDANEPFAYRDRARLQVVWRRGRPRLGYYARGSNHLVEFARCPLLNGVLNDGLESLRRLLDGRLGTAAAWHQLEAVELERALDGWALSLRFARPRPPKLPWDEIAAALPGLVSLRAAGRKSDRRVAGAERFATVEVGLVKSTGTFGQPSDAGARWLRQRLAAAKEIVAVGTVWDLYAGYGLLGSVLLAEAGVLFAVEVAPAAAEDAAANLASTDTEVIIGAGRVEAALEQIPAELARPDLVILDPPRSGLGKGILRSLLAYEPGALFFAACNPSRFWRDAQLLLDAGYQLADLAVFDMAPQTEHLELASLWLRGRPRR